MRIVPWNENTLSKDKNPLGKVPSLIINENEYIFDSKVIIRYLDQIKPKPEIYPIDPKNHQSWGRVNSDALAQATASSLSGRARKSHSPPRRNLFVKCQSRCAQLESHYSGLSK